MWQLALLVLPLAAACAEDDGELRLVGTVERTLVELVAPASETVVEVRVERGEHVSPGQVLVRLDRTFAAADIARAEAVLAGARTNLAVAEQDLGRSRKLRQQNVSSEQAHDRATLARDEALARLREAEAQLVAMRKRDRDLTLAAPTAGVVDQLPYDLGERVPAGAVVAVVVSDGEPWVRVWVPERSAAHVYPGTPAEITVDDIGVLRGSVLDVARQPEFTPHYALTERDRVHLVYEARVRILDAPPMLRPGLPAQVRIVPETVLREAR